MDLDEASRVNWDVIIIGTGMAGATAGYALAQAGKRVCFCERGKRLLQSNEGLRGGFAEEFFPVPAVPDIQHRLLLQRAGRYADYLTDTSTDRRRNEIPFIGCGTGGSSAIYGAALERLFPADFTPRKHHPGADSSTLPEEWPVSYSQMAPYYERAERLFRLRGSADPARNDSHESCLQPPPPLSAVSQEIHDHLTTRGQHPYRLPQACEFVDGCRGCQGFLCPRDCKNDSTRICLSPAIEVHGACLLDECEVITLESDHHRVTGVACRQRGQQARLRGKLIILAAGALETPRLLLASATPDHPQGLANDSGLVGRNLMRHYVDLYAILPRTRDGHPGNLKELAFNDFYLDKDGKFGTVQSFGSLPTPAIITKEMHRDLQYSALHWLAPLFYTIRPFLRPLLGRVFARRVIYASIMEDLPYADNRVLLPDAAANTTGSRLLIQYRVCGHEQARIRQFRSKVKAAFETERYMLIKQAENNARIAHACGTCRFGTDPRTSVLDASNRAHAVENLSVLDASFFPSSGGTNPALTLAANALRVSDLILDRQVHEPPSISLREPR